MLMIVWLFDVFVGFGMRFQDGDLAIKFAEVLLIRVLLIG